MHAIIALNAVWTGFTPAHNKPVWTRYTPANNKPVRAGFNPTQNKPVRAGFTPALYSAQNNDVWDGIHPRPK